MTENLKFSITAAIEAGKAILEVYAKDFEVGYKADKSPLTKADKNAHTIIVKYLEATNIPILSEEGKEIPFEKRKAWSKLWIVDPLDGTKEFIKKNGEFTVNIALVENGSPVLGVIYVPVKDELYFASNKTGSKKTTGAGEMTSISEIISHGVELPVMQGNRSYTAVGSKSHMNEETEVFIKSLEARQGKINFLSRGSSLKICMVAEGSADIYPRFAPTMEWDVAAGHAIAKYSGAQMINYETGRELTYNTKDSLLNPWFVVNR